MTTIEEYYQKQIEKDRESINSNYTIRVESKFHTEITIPESMKHKVTGDTVNNYITL